MFHECKSLEEKKKLYRRLSKHLHPDCGGHGDLMALLTRTFELATRFSAFDPEPEEDDSEKWDGVFRHESERITEHSEKVILISLILLYASENAGFKTDFVKSIQKFLIEKGFITAKQYNCLVDLFYSRKIDEWAKKTKN